jgi:hypothetical protein
MAFAANSDMQNINDVVNTALEFLRHEDTVEEDTATGDFDLPWDIHPHEFLQFAEADLAGKEHHRLVNSLANAKRAMECQADSLLLAYGLLHYAKKQRWGLPKKLEALQELGIAAPRILSKINSERNLLEHEYTRPEESKVTDFVDIVALFIASTQMHLESHYYFHAGFINLETDDLPVSNVYYEVDTESGIIHLTVGYPDREGNQIEIPAGHECYTRVIRAVLTVLGLVSRKQS